MKTIHVDDDTYNFLVELSKELNTQDNRYTADPYFFQIQKDKDVVVPEGCGDIVWECGGDVLKTKEDIKGAVFEYNVWDENNIEHQELFNDMEEEDIEFILSRNFRKHEIQTVHVYENSFLTAKACDNHIRLNSYHYKNPITYLSHANRNPELERVLKFLKSITKEMLS